jgi:hypothetical protein
MRGTCFQKRWDEFAAQVQVSLVPDQVAEIHRSIMVGLTISPIATWILKMEAVSLLVILDFDLAGLAYRRFQYSPWLATALSTF